MPSSPSYVRDYKQERKTDLARGGLAKNASRKRARRKLEAKGIVKKFDGKDVDHKNGNPKDNSVSNLRVQSKSANRSYPRTKSAGKK